MDGLLFILMALMDGMLLVSVAWLTKKYFKLRNFMVNSLAATATNKEDYIDSTESTATLMSQIL